MHKIGVIGDKDSILGFKALGIHVFHDAQRDVNELIQELVKEGYVILFITEEYLAKARTAIAKYEDMPVPAIIPIPGIRGSMGIGMQNIRKAAEKAIGADILFKEK
ncbi:MAG: V-type ATP synthase subunit F [Clostridia bacterium]